MADVSVCRWDAFAQRIVIYAVVWCRTAFDRELYVLEPLSLGPHKVPYVAPANSKEHESKSHNSPPRTTCGEGLRYCWPQDKPVRRPREFSFRSRTNTNPIHRARPAGRPVGSACGFLRRKEAGQVQLESAVQSLLEAAIFASSIPYLDVSGDSLAAREGGRRGSRSLSIQLTLCSSSLSACNKTRQSVPQQVISVVNSAHRSGGNVCSKLHGLRRTCTRAVSYTHLTLPTKA